MEEIAYNAVSFTWDVREEAKVNKQTKNKEYRNGKSKQRGICTWFGVVGTSRKKCETAYHANINAHSVSGQCYTPFTLHSYTWGLTE